MSDSWEELAVAMADMARDLLAQASVQSTLDRIVHYAVDTVDGCDEAGVLTLEGKTVRTLASSNGLVRKSDRIQGELGEGPCFDATRRVKDVYRIEDMTTTVQRWPRYAPYAREMGVGSMMGFLLYTEDDNLGALDLYSYKPRAFTARSERVGWMLASHAAVSFSSARTHAQLDSALESRREIGAALGIIMERYGTDQEGAFAVLKKSSQDHNIKLRDIARRMTETGELPGAG